MADSTTITPLSTTTRTRGRTSWRTRSVLFGLTATLAALGAACGGGSEGSSEGEKTTGAEETAPESSTSASTTTTAAPLTFEQASDAYNGCLEDNGSNTDAIPTGQSMDDLAEVDPTTEALLELGIDETFLAAHKVCWPPFRAAMDAGATPPTAPPTTVDPVKAQQMAQAVQCLNERGWDFLEPGVETGALTMAARQADFNWDDPGFLQDQMQCQQLAGMMG